MFGIVNNSVVPMRAEPSERSEMVSQLLWGETIKIEKQEQGWLYVSNTFDRYRGWITESMILRTNEEAWLRCCNQPYCVNNVLGYALQENTGERTLIPHGAVLYNYNELMQEFALDKYVYKMEEAQQPAPKNVREGIAQTAKGLLNAPYLWGGRTALGIDCSGFTQLVFRLNQIALPRDANQQAQKGKPVDFPASCHAGDLAFFGKNEGKITHVGVILDQQKIIHASGKVRIDQWDSEGIYNESKKQYTHKLRLIKQIIIDENRP